MTEVSVHEAKTHLSRLLRRVALGEEIVISRGGEPIARLVPATPRRPRRLGLDEGRFEVPEDFDAELPEMLYDAGIELRPARGRLHGANEKAHLNWRKAGAGGAALDFVLNVAKQARVESEAPERRGLNRQARA